MTLSRCCCFVAAATTTTSVVAPVGLLPGLHFAQIEVTLGTLVTPLIGPRFKRHSIHMGFGGLKSDTHRENRIILVSNGLWRMVKAKNWSAVDFGYLVRG